MIHRYARGRIRRFDPMNARQQQRTDDDRTSLRPSSFVLRPSCSQLVTVPPILFLGRHLSPRQRRRPLLVWRVLPAIAVAAAMRASAVVQAPYGSHRVAHPTHLAPHRPAQSPSRRHRCRRWPALTRPFHPLPGVGGWGLGVGYSNPQPPTPNPSRRVCSLLPSFVASTLPPPRPRLLFRGVAFLCQD